MLGTPAVKRGDSHAPTAPTLVRTRRNARRFARNPSQARLQQRACEDAKAVRSHDDDGCCFAPGAHPQDHAPGSRCRASRGDGGHRRRLPYQAGRSRFCGGRGGRTGGDRRRRGRAGRSVPVDGQPPIPRRGTRTSIPTSPRIATGSKARLGHRARTTRTGTNRTIRTSIASGSAACR